MRVGPPARPPRLAASPEDFAGEYETKSVAVSRPATFAGRNWKMGFSPPSLGLSRNTRRQDFSATFHSFPLLERVSPAVRSRSRTSARPRMRAPAYALSGKTWEIRRPGRQRDDDCRARELLAQAEVTPLKLNFTDPLALPS